MARQRRHRRKTKGKYTLGGYSASERFAAFINSGPRVRKYTIRYGGELAGRSNTGDRLVTAFTGEHFCADETHPGPPYNSGGPLTVRKKKVQIARSPHHYVFYHSSLGWYDGKMYVNPYIPSPEPSALPLIGWGARGYNATIPTHPIYQLGVSLLELKDLPGMLSQTRKGLQALAALDKRIDFRSLTVREFLNYFKRLPKDAGNTYLYGAFGLYPMLQDLYFLTKMQEKLDKKIAWLRRHNGKSFRRKITLDSGGFSENIPRSIAPLVSVSPTLSSDLYAAGQSANQSIPVLKTYQRRIWFSAKYRYYIPELDDSHGRRPVSTSLKLFLLGLSADPSIIYKVMPWSWLLDWFTSVGASLSNVYNMAKYGVVAEYAYVMCKETYTYQAPGYITLHSGKLGPLFNWVDPDWHWSGTSKTIYEFRTREVANPFGFGVTFASLSAFQWSILAALGLSRGGKHSAPRA